MLYTDGAMNVFCLYIFIQEILMLFVNNISFSIQSELFHKLNFKHLILVIKEHLLKNWKLKFNFF